jgi:hypothetical protein
LILTRTFVVLYLQNYLIIEEKSYG